MKLVQDSKKLRFRQPRSFALSGPIAISTSEETKELLKTSHSPFKSKKKLKLCRRGAKEKLRLCVRMTARLCMCACWCVCVCEGCVSVCVRLCLCGNDYISLS